MNIFKFILFFFGVFISNSCFAQYQFEKLTTSDGLSLNIIRCIVEDDEGFMYIGTSNGLNVYDGNTIKKINPATYLNFGKRAHIITQISPSKILIGTEDKGLFIYNKELKRMLSVQLQSNSEILDLPILSMHNDSKGNLWIGTLKKGLFSLKLSDIQLYNGEGSISCNEYIGVEKREINTITSSHGKIWVGTRYKGLFSIEENENSNFKTTASPLVLSSPNIWKLKTFGDLLFVGTESGLNIINLKTKKNNLLFEKPNDPSLSNNIIRAFVKDASGTYWIGTQEDGLYSMKFLKENTEIKHFKNNPTNSNSLNINKILSLYIDKNDNLWIGTWNGGVNLLSHNSKQFLNIRNQGKENDLSENMIWSITQKEPNTYSIGTHGSGLNSYEIGQSFFTEELNTMSINSVWCTYLDSTRNILWVGTWGKGLKAFSYPKMIPMYEDLLDRSKLKNDRILAISEDEHGIIWISGESQGIFSLNLNDTNQTLKSIRKFNSFLEEEEEEGVRHTEFRAIVPDKNNVLWIGSYINGLFKANTDTKGVIIKVERVRLNTPLNENKESIRTVFLDSDDNLWIGQENGIINFIDKKSDSSHVISKLKNTIISDFAEDVEGNIWIATYNGLIRYNPKSGDAQNFLTEICFYTLFFDIKNGQLIAGSNRGIFTFIPSKLKADPIYPEIIFSELKFGNQIVHPKEEFDGVKPLIKAINYTNSITLPYTKNVFSIDITAMSYTMQNKNIIQYQLENFENTWNQKIGAATSIVYTNLQPGAYVLKVKTANNDKVWNPDVRKLTITILPPWWRTSWAYFSYFLLIFLIGFIIYKVIRDRIRADQTLKIGKVKKEQNDILNEQKLSFFTNISHEFRTPLTLILGPLENIIGKAKKGTVLHRQLEMMEKNTNLLLQLVNQVLDFRKFEKYKTRLKVTSIHLNDLVIQMLGQFEGKALQKNISIQFSSKKQNILLWADEDLLRKVLLNLLSNSIKYTHSGGWVQISIEESSQYIRLSVKDNGKGIQKKDLPNIFQRFYQTGDNVQGSTGIGLALVKEMIELHKGTIKVVSELNKGSEFMIDFLNGKGHFNTSDFKQEKIIVVDESQSNLLNSQNNTISNKKPSILIIDDNDDIRQFIVDNLSYDFTTFNYNNATDALAFAQTKDLALIICDIMMPGMNGLKFCEHIKSNLQTSHVPVILLTAKSDDEFKIEGYNKGADEYITKPFKTKILISRVHNLIEQRENLKKKIKRLNLEPSKIAPTSLDEQFLAKSIKYIEENISNHEYSINNLSSAMGLSHDNFYRKIKSLSGMSATQFIRMIKLKRAAQMLVNTDYSISEILYEVGFTNPSYFTKCFKQQFGVSPKEYKNLA